MSKKTALITGAGGGIGSTIAKYLSAQSYDLILIDIDKEQNQAIADSLPNSTAITLDLSNRDELRQFCQRIPELSVDVAFINAGVVFTGEVVELSEQQIDLQLEINLRSAIILNQALAKDMSRRQQGHIINTVSLGGISAMKGTAVYSASKFGLRGFLSALYSEMKPFNVKISGIYPGAVDTPMLRYEAQNNGSPLNFLSPPKQTEDVLRGFQKALNKGVLEVHIPYSDGLLSRVVAFFPHLLNRLYPIFESIGERGRQKYLSKKDS